MAVPEEVKQKIRGKAKVVLMWRNQVQARWNSCSELETAFHELNADLYARLEKAKEELKANEEALRQLALSVFRETNDKRPGPGVEIKVYDVLSYDEIEALKWGLEYKVAIKLDKKVFEPMAKINLEPFSMNFVTITQEPRALIATDLERLWPIRRRNESD